MNLASAGYFLAASAFFVLAILLKSSWRGGWRGGTLVSAVVISIIWAGLAGFQALHAYPGSVLLAITELLRNGAWLAFLFLLLLTQTRKEDYASHKRLQVLAGLVAVALISMVGILSYAGLVHQTLPDFIGFGWRIFIHIMFAVIGLLLIELMFRNASQQRWKIKYLCLGIGGLFVFDFYLYTDAFLLNQLDEDIWGARGYVNAMVVPLLAVSAARNPDWSLEIHVSRKFVFHTTTLMAAGIYLLAMAAGGYYIKLYGGQWGGIAQLTFLFGALIVLGILMFSGTLRARIRLFLSRNFFSYRYDYREEWLRFINTLSDEKLEPELRERVVQAVGEIVESPSGALWLKQGDGSFVLKANSNMAVDSSECNRGLESLIIFLEDKQWVIDIEEYNRVSEVYESLELPGWINKLPQAWLIVPLFQQHQLYGFIILAQSRVRQKINWEDRDLLITTGRGATNYLALLDANEALFNARQFEAFNRLSAYVVHDLKNVIAQLALVVKNAAKHKHNPAFMDDAINTIDNAVGKMTRMLDQLRKDRTAIQENAINRATRANLVEIVKKVITQRQVENPVPILQVDEEVIMLEADKERTASVISHLIQNAQEATPDAGYVSVGLYKNNTHAIIEIIDNGCGMDATFIQKRLFKPFETTKGNAGMGIGVYESKEFIQSIGGSMDVKSTPGEGTTFTLTLKLDVEREPLSRLN